MAGYAGVTYAEHSKYGPLVSGKPVLTVTAGLMGWYDSSDNGSFDISTGPVATWRDLSGNGNTATGPGTKPNRLGGKNGVQFTGNGAFLDSPMSGSNVPHTVVTAMQPLANVGNQCAWIGQQFNGSGALELRAPDSALVTALASSVGAIGTSSAPIVYGQKSTHVWTYDGANWTMRWAGASIGSGSSGVTFTAGRGTEIGCSNQYNGESFNGILFELLKYSRVLGAQEILDVEKYLRQKYGLV